MIAGAGDSEMAASDSEDLWTLTEYRTSEGEVRVLAPVLSCSTEVHLYTIPSFAVVQVQLRRIKYQLHKSLSRAVITLDGLIKDDPSLDRLYPAELSFAVPVGLNYPACYVKVADLEECPTLEPDLKNFMLFPNNDEVLVIWDWKWSDCDNTLNDDDDPDEITVIPETPPEPESDNDTDATENNDNTSPDEIEHRVTFKCIGCTKEQPYQQALIRAAQLRREGTKVEVKVEPEPTNPFDAKAIQVKCKVDGEWKRIGYLVSEVLDEVHNALNTNRIVSVDFEWIKLIVVWRTPGWYAGVNITRKGEWSKTVLISQSART